MAWSSCFVKFMALLQMVIPWVCYGLLVAYLSTRTEETLLSWNLKFDFARPRPRPFGMHSLLFAAVFVYSVMGWKLFKGAGKADKTGVELLLEWFIFAVISLFSSWASVTLFYMDNASWYVIVYVALTTIAHLFMMFVVGLRLYKVVFEVIIPQRRAAGESGNKEKQECA